MLQTYKSYTRRTLAMLLAVLVAVGALFSGSFPVHAADGTISYKAGANIPYGSYFTSRMSFDGSNTAYCVEPLKKTPSSGSYSYDLLSQNSPLRKALYYLNGGYGYDKVVKDKYFSEKRNLFHFFFGNITGQTPAPAVSKENIKITAVVADKEYRFIRNIFFTDHGCRDTGHLKNHFKAPLNDAQRTDIFGSAIEFTNDPFHQKNRNGQDQVKN